MGESIKMLVKSCTYNFPPHTRWANPHKADWPILAGNWPALLSVKLLYFFSFNTMDQLLDFRDRLLKREKQTMVKPPASCLGKIFSIGGIYIEPYFLSLSFRTYYRLICVMSSLNSVQSRINSYSALFLSSSQK